MSQKILDKLVDKSYFLCDTLLRTKNEEMSDIGRASIRMSLIGAQLSSPDEVSAAERVTKEFESLAQSGIEALCLLLRR